MSREHVHYCENRRHGCTSTYVCDAPLERNYDGCPEVVCSINPGDDGECEDCATSYCEDCGVCLNLEAHAASYELAAA